MRTDVSGDRETTVANVTAVAIQCQRCRLAVTWVQLAYRLPREPSTPRIAVWRRLRRLGAVQIVDGLVALPRDSRTQEQLEWLADEILEANGEATIWVATPGSAAHERALAERMAAAVAAEYQAVIDAAEAARTKDGAVRRRTLARLRRTLQAIRAATSFRHPSASSPSGRWPNWQRSSRSRSDEMGDAKALPRRSGSVLLADPPLP